MRKSAKLKTPNAERQKAITLRVPAVNASKRMEDKTKSIGTWLFRRPASSSGLRESPKQPSCDSHEQPGEMCSSNRQVHRVG